MSSNASATAAVLDALRAKRDQERQVAEAAHDMLAALKRLVRQADSEPDGEYLQGAMKGCVAVHRSCIEAARAAIAKAEAAQ